MEPTLSDGERLLVDKITYRLRPPERGEIIVFHYPADPKRKFIKRVIGLPGDVIQIRGHQLYLNGVPVEVPYLNGRVLESFGPVRVPETHVLVLGDHRNNPDHSRCPDAGPVPMEMAVGAARQASPPPSRFG